jgi:hypothetical protein
MREAGMRTPARILLVSTACALVTACGGGGEQKPARFDGPNDLQPVSLAQQGSPRAAPPTPAALSLPPTASLRTQPPAAAVAVAPATVARARFNPDGLDAVRIAADLQRFGNAVADEKSCPWGELACDATYTASVNLKLHGSVGHLIQDEGKAHFDAEDVVQLPVVPAPLSVFIQSSAESKDALYVTLEDRQGSRLFALPPIAPGAATAFGWTRTDDAAGAPFRLRLQAPAGPGEHSIDYVLLPVPDAEWHAGFNCRSSPARPAPGGSCSGSARP